MTGTLSSISSLVLFEMKRNQKTATQESKAQAERDKEATYEAARLDRERLSKDSESESQQ